MRREKNMMLKGMCRYMCMYGRKMLQSEMCGSAMHDLNMEEKYIHNMC